MCRCAPNGACSMGCMLEEGRTPRGGSQNKKLQGVYATNVNKLQGVYAPIEYAPWIELHVGVCFMEMYAPR